MFGNEWPLLHFERTFDYELIKKIATHPRVYPNASDDFSPSPEDWEPIRHEQIWYVLARDGEELLGMFALIPENMICWNIHVCLLPNSWGPKAKEAGEQIIHWIFENTPCLRLVADVPEYNTLVLNLAMRSGMQKYGINEKSHKKGGILHNQIQMGISKEVH